MTKYEQRITIFIDILGFRNIVKKTELDEEFTDKIFDVLNSMESELLGNELFAEINIDNTDPKFERVKELRDLFSEAFKSKSSIQISHFSDSIVFSIGLESDMNTMTLIEYLGRIIYRLWREFRILIRGGVSIDKLIHSENGILFGPAMVKAYDYETNLADFPRIVFDDLSYIVFKKSKSYDAMKNLIKPFSSKKEINGKTIEIKNGFEINLGTSILHLLNSTLTLNTVKRNEVLNILNNLTKELTTLKDEATTDNIKEKYKYLIDEIERIIFPTM
jgi:hypothetical protein